MPNARGVKGGGWDRGANVLAVVFFHNLNLNSPSKLEHFVSTKWGGGGAPNC